MFLAKIKDFFKNNKRIIRYFILFFLLYSLSSEFTFAEDKTWSEQDFVNLVIQIVDLVLAFVSAVLWAVTALVSWFLTPEWYNWKIFWLDKLMKELWILVSNIAYVAFAIVLIVIAFMNIINRWDKWELKEALPRFVVWVLLVPVSWFIVQFTLSVSWILTTSVLLLPHHIIENNNIGLDYAPIEWKMVDTKYELNLWSIKCENLKKSCCTEFSANTWRQNWDGEFMRSCEGKDVKSILKWEEVNWELKWWLGNSSFGIVSVYTYAIMSVQETDSFKMEDWRKWVTKITDLFQKVVFDALFVIMYAVLMIALFLALFVRWITLWLYTIFSPIFGLLYFFWKSSEWVWSGSFKFSLKEFLSLAMVPVYVAAALAFGFIFIMAVLKSAEGGIADADGCFKFWGVFNFCINWAIWEATESTVNYTLWALWRLIMQILGLVILWIWVFAALKTSSITANIVKPIEDFWGQIWTLVMKSPMYAPIIPAWNWSFMSMNSAQQIASKGMQYLDDKSRQPGFDFMKEHRLFWMEPDSLSKQEAAVKAQDAIKHSNSLSERMQQMENMILAHKSIPDIANTKESVDTLKMMAENVGLDKNLWEDLNGPTSDYKKVKELIWALDKYAKDNGTDMMRGKEWNRATSMDEMNAALAQWHKERQWGEDTSNSGDGGVTNETSIKTDEKNNTIIFNAISDTGSSIPATINRNADTNSSGFKDLMTSLSAWIASGKVSEKHLNDLDLLLNSINTNDIIKWLADAWKLNINDNWKFEIGWSGKKATEDDIKNYFGKETSWSSEETSSESSSGWEQKEETQATENESSEDTTTE